MLCVVRLARTILGGGFSRFGDGVALDLGAETIEQTPIGSCQGRGNALARYFRIARRDAVAPPVPTHFEHEVQIAPQHDLSREAHHLFTARSDDIQSRRAA